MKNGTIYQVVFVQGGYTCVDYETNNYEQAVEVMEELHSQMYIAGERNFDYIIKQLKKGVKGNESLYREKAKRLLRL